MIPVSFSFDGRRSNAIKKLDEIVINRIAAGEGKHIMYIHKLFEPYEFV